ncbi:MAG TPA: radical SAM protein [Bryobacteraceae bacterium]|nr:radical SAM protein [Bryobacteraceae bacterium]
MPFEVFQSRAGSILSATTGFIAEAGFTHSLTPARNCTFGCTYCYVPTMRLYGGLKPDDWRHWGQFTTFKTNAPELLRRELRDHHMIYCSPLVDPYQPAEESEQMMPRILDELLSRPPKVFVIQTRGPLIVRDLAKLVELSRLTALRVSFSLTTNRERVRKLYEPHCATLDCRLRAIRELRAAGIATFATLAPLLPCDPEQLAEIALESTDQDIIGDPLHVRSVKPRGATTREAAARISERHGFSEWLDPEFQRNVVQRIGSIVRRAGRRFATGTEGFGWLAH